jgi:hypothetical protein
MRERGVDNEDREPTARMRDELAADEATSPVPGEFGPAPTDAGRTSGGGSLGHKAPPDVAETTSIRNHPPDARRDDERGPDGE